jgi:thiamine pyrophosphokinase
MLGPKDFEGGPIVAFDGDIPSVGRIHSLSGDSDAIVIAADGAARTLRALGIRPHVVIGDFDAMGSDRDDSWYSGTEFILDDDQNEYDGAKAVNCAIQRGSASVTVLGASGGRVDHILNNYSILARFASRVHIRTAEESDIGYIVDQPFQFEAREGDRISLIPLPEARLTTEGLRWNLKDEIIRFGEREGCSNAATDDTVTISNIDGIALIVHYG